MIQGFESKLLEYKGYGEGYLRGGGGVGWERLEWLQVLLCVAMPRDA